MTDHPRAGQAHYERRADREPKPGEDGEDGFSDGVVFNSKGIGANVGLAAAAALVPLLIVGVAGIKAILGAKRGKR